MSDLYLAAFPQMAEHFGAGPSGIQATLTTSLIGLAAGQLVVGPVSDRYGRRRPLIVGMAIFAVASVLCALAPSIGVLLAGRFVQGLTGAAGVVISRAVVRDLYEGDAFVRFFARLMLVFGVAPVIAPLVGTALLQLGDWRLQFVALAVFGLALLLSVLGALPETLPPDRRTSGGTAAAVRTMGRLLGDRHFLSYALGCGFAIAAMFAYIGGFSFVAQDVHGASGTVFSVLFGVNAAGFIAAGQLSAKLLVRIRPRQQLLAGAAVQTAGALALAALVLFDPPGGAGPGLAGVEVALFVVVSALGFVMPNATALALADNAAVAGTAAALLGALQLAAGAAAAPLVGLGGSGSAVPLGLVVLGLAASALAVLALGGRTPIHSRATSSVGAKDGPVTTAG
jgi:DHA1 family bicyclomycin/chloramphenicol resistance-like MFS transporter